MTFTKNPFLDQSINQRETPGFNQATLNAAFSQTVQGPPAQSLNDFLKDKVYQVINKFQEVTKGQAAASWEQFRQVMTEITQPLGNRETDIA